MKDEYCKVASRLESQPGFHRLLMKGIFVAYVLFFELLMCVRTCDLRYTKSCGKVGQFVLIRICENKMKDNTTDRL